jgi:hypothetical protein
MTGLHYYGKTAEQDNLIIIYTIAVVGRASRLSSNLKGI